jgi:3-isopropylmalate/(R)-2-methylmalate dehydratase small subunit
MEGIDKEFNNKSRDGVILVVGENFGSGSSREQAPISLKNAHVKCIVAKSFARIFYRNSINIGLPVLECSEVWNGVKEEDILTISLEKGEIRNNRTTDIFHSQPLPEFIINIVKSGGLLNKLKEDIEKDAKDVHLSIS